MLLAADPAHAFMPYPPAPVPHAHGGPLAGLTFAVKDLFDVEGYPTSAGSPTMLAQSGIKSVTAPTVMKLLRAGAGFVGKTITDELAFSMNGRNAHFGTPRNGADPARITGGSSSGSAAAVSNSLCDFALGTDTGGSVRAPASHCGLLGLRPTHARISLALCHDLSPSFDTCGFFARDIASFARVGQLLPGDDPVTLASRPGWLLADDVLAQLDPDARAALAPALERIEATLGQAQTLTSVAGDYEQLYWAYRKLQGHEAWLTDGPMIKRHKPPLGPGVAERFEWASKLTDEELQPCHGVRQRFREQLRGTLGRDRILVLPTMPDVAPLLTQSEEALDVYRNRALHLLCLAGMSGCPQLSLPLLSRDGAPWGVSLLGPPGTDRALIAIGRAILAGAKYPG